MPGYTLNNSNMGCIETIQVLHRAFLSCRLIGNMGNIETPEIVPFEILLDLINSNMGYIETTWELQMGNIIFD